jgi:ubiquinone biosynthesis accessory factor UbiK
MIDQDFIKGLSSKAAALFPAADKARQQLESDLQKLLQRSLANLPLVTREEFQTQLALLERANQKIDELERKLDALENTRAGPQA